MARRVNQFFKVKNSLARWFHIFKFFYLNQSLLMYVLSLYTSSMDLLWPEYQHISFCYLKMEQILACEIKDSLFLFWVRNFCRVVCPNFRHPALSSSFTKCEYLQEKNSFAAIVNGLSVFSFRSLIFFVACLQFTKCLNLKWRS